MHHILYTYNISKLNPSKKVRFVYLLKGRRDEPGLIKSFNGKFLAPGCFMIPASKDKEMLEVIKMWGVKAKRLLIELKKEVK
jgi:hypothetical protein